MADLHAIWELLLLFLRLGLTSFGGSLAAMPEIQRAVVQQHAWLTPTDFVAAYAIAQVAPGPSLLVSIPVGYGVAGPLGALVATLAFFLPSTLLAWSISHWWHRLHDAVWIITFRRAMAPVAAGLLAAGVLALGRAAIVDGLGAALAIVTAVFLLRTRVPAAVLITGAGVLGAVGTSLQL